MLRTGYTARVRPWRDSDRDVEIRWYKCRPGAPALPYPSLFRSLHWESHAYLFAAGKGEVFNSVKRVYPFKWLPGLDATHPPCGTEQDFAQGGHYDAVTPPVPVTPDGIPLCCAGPPGGVVVAGGPVEIEEPQGVAVGGDPVQISAPQGLLIGGGAMPALPISALVDGTPYLVTSAICFRSLIHPIEDQYTGALGGIVLSGPSVTGVPMRWEVTVDGSTFAPVAPSGLYRVDGWDTILPVTMNLVSGDPGIPPTCVARLSR